jgi:outer membrane protein assembly factor BamB
MRRRLITALVAVASVASFAQLGDPSKESMQSVYVHDSAVAAEKFALAERMERLKEWNKAADIYQEILEKNSDNVIAANNAEPASGVSQYTTVATAVQDKLSKWPEEGLAIYRARYEASAAAILQGAPPDDLAAPAKVISLYFATDTGKRAAMRMIDLHLESGDFSAAAWIGQRLLDAHPALGADRPAIVYRTALACHLGGDEPRAKALLTELQHDSPDAIVTIAGKDANLVESLKRELASPPPTEARVAEDSWPMFGGGSDRDRLSTANGKAGARVATIPYTRASYRGSRAMQLDRRRREQLAMETGQLLGVMPVADRGELFFQDSSRIYAVSLESGFPLPGWTKTYGADHDGAFSAHTWPMPHDQQMTLTLTDSNVLAVMGLPDRAAMQEGQPTAAPGTRLVCLDRGTGELKWTCTPRTFDGEFAKFQALELSGSPVVVGDHVYLSARGSKGNQFEDAYLLCVDLATGKPRWCTYLASASIGMNGWMEGAFLTTESASHVAYAGGRIYDCTNIGAVACVDAFSGAVLWLDTYPRDSVPDGNVVARIRFNARAEPTSLPARPWSYNPTVVDHGHVVVLPGDSKNLFVFDAGTGREIKRVEMADLIADSDIAPDTLLSVRGDQVVVAGSTRVFCLNWQAYDHNTFDLKDINNPAVVWPRQLSSPIKGRGFVTADFLYLPTEERLLQINLKGGKIIEATPPFGRAAWSKEKDEGRGNLLITDDHIVIAGATQLEVRTDLSLARRRLDTLVANQPNDPGTRLTYAETMFNAGEQALALQKVEEAVTMIAGHPGADRDRLFNLCLTFAKSLLAQSTPDSLAMAGKLFDYAEPAAGSTDQKVHYLLQRAKLERSRKDPAAEVRLVQAILSSDELRGVAVMDDDMAASTPAGLLAQHAIARGIAESGPECYAPYEAAAAKALASTAQDPAAMLSLANQYPNSKAAPKALFAAADLYEAQNQPRPATQTLRQLYFRFPDTPDKARVLESLARNYLALPGREDVAGSRLAYAAKLFENQKLSKPLKLPGGKVLENMTFAQAAAALKETADTRQAANLPDFHLPSDEQRNAYKKQFGKVLDPYQPEALGSAIHNVAAVLAPVREFSRSDRVLAFKPSQGLACYPIGQTKPIWVAKSVSAPPTAVAWLGNDLLAWDSSGVCLIAAGNGDVAWRVELKSIPSPEPAAPPDNEELVNNPNAGNRQVFINGGVIINGPAAINAQQRLIQRRQLALLQQQMQGIQIRGGAVRIIGGFPNINQPPNPNLGGAEQIVDAKCVSDRIVLATSAGRVIALSPATGRLAWQSRLTASPIETLVANDDFVGAHYMDEAASVVVGLDAYAGQVLFRKSLALDDHACVNLALAADGTLVYTTFSTISGKDLYDPSPNLTFEVSPVAENVSIFAGMSAPDQLLIQGQRIIAISDNGTLVRVHSLTDGKPIRANPADAGSRQLDALQTGSTDPNVRMRIAGSHLYVFSPRSIFAYDLDHLDDPDKASWSQPFDAGGSTRIRDAFIGQDYLILINDPGAGKTILQCFLRTQIKGFESGLWVHNKALTSPTGIPTVLPVDSGLYYLTGDNTLHFLKGARE